MLFLLLLVSMDFKSSINRSAHLETQSEIMEVGSLACTKELGTRGEEDREKLTSELKISRRGEDR